MTVTSPPSAEFIWFETEISVSAGAAEPRINFTRSFRIRVLSPQTWNPRRFDQVSVLFLMSRNFPVEFVGRGGETRLRRKQQQQLIECDKRNGKQNHKEWTGETCKRQRVVFRVIQAAKTNGGA